MSGRNPRGAALGASFYESPEIVDCFQDIIEPLTVDLKQRDTSFTARDLSLFVGQLQQFQQECLGAFNRPPNPPLRIPAKLFKVTPKVSLTIDTPIYTMLKTAYRHRLNHGWKKWDFGNPLKKQRNADLVQAIRVHLIKKQYITIPKIAISEQVSDIKEVYALVKSIKAFYVEDKSEATHILYGKLHEYSTDGAAEEDWFRTLEKDGPLVLVHWWYYPDSFDEWLPQKQQFADPEEAPEHTGPWRLNVRWLQDTVRFNEIMNEEDYEVADEGEDDDDEDEEDDEDDDDESVSKKRKLSELYALTKGTSKAPTSLESLAPPVPVINPDYQPLVRVRDIDADKPQVGSRQRKNEFEPYLNGEITNISQYTAAHVEYPKRFKSQKLDEEMNETAVNVPLLIKSTPCDYEDMELPPWYNAESIHDIEKLALPEFFTNDNLELTPEKYKHYRDHMINTYKANPDYFLTVSACKSKLDVDLVTLVRVHSFLVNQGMINSRVSDRCIG